MPKEMFMDDHDIAKQLANIKHYEFWKLVRKHRPWLTRKETAALLGVSVRCLEVWWERHKGPMPVWKGRLIRYHIDVVEAFMPKPD